MKPSRQLFLDLETFSTVDIKKGTYKYAENAEIMLWLYSIDGATPKCYDAMHDSLMPDDLAEALFDEETRIIVHNVDFDRVVMKYNGYDIPIDRFWCTAALARSISLNGSLDWLCGFLELGADVAKQKDGTRLIRKFCCPQAKTKRRIMPWEDLEDWLRFIDYGLHDITAMIEVYKRLPHDNWVHDREGWIEYQRMNDLGFLVDTQLANSAVEAVAYEAKCCKTEAQEITGDDKITLTRTAAILAYLQSRGVKIDNLQSATLDELLKSAELPADVVRLLELRKANAKTSMAKYKRALEGMNSDTVLRGTMLFNGALRTGRNTGRIFQPLNLPRPTVHGATLDDGIELLREGYGFASEAPIMELAASALRGVIIARPGRRLVVSDWTAIEGRIQCWTSREEWKLQAYRNYDAGTGHDLYKIAYAAMVNKDPSEVTKDERQVGKVAELALGYQGAIPAFITFLTAYRVDIDDLVSKGVFPDAQLKEKAKRLLFARKRGRETLYGLTDNQFLVLAYFVYAWRAKHPMITSAWVELEEGMRECVKWGEYSGDRYQFSQHDRFTRLHLPSGRMLHYLDVKVDARGKLSLLDPRYGRIGTYGGMIFENHTQAVNRDLIVPSLRRSREMGIAPLLTIYDEIVGEADALDDESMLAFALEQVMVQGEEWSIGLPLAAAAFECPRYKKG